jgi:hypothetical protein
MDAVAPSEVLESLYAFVSQESRYILWNEAVSERKLLIWHYNCYKYREDLLDRIALVAFPFDNTSSKANSTTVRCDKTARI